MPKLHRKRSLLAKIESSYGSDPTATGSANYVEVVDLEIEPVASDEVEQETIRPYAGNYPVLLANTRVNVSFYYSRHSVIYGDVRANYTSGSK